MTGEHKGGLVQCAAGSEVVADSWAGGLIGFNTSLVQDCCSHANVSARQRAAGLIADNSLMSRVYQCYAAGRVTCEADGGGLVAKNISIIDSGLWDVEASGVEVSDGGVGRTTEQMKQQATFTGWDLDTVWMICEGQDYPRLRWENVQCGP